MDHYRKLVDIDWYAGEANRTFDSSDAAVAHYLDEGEKKGLFPNPLFDPAFYRHRYGLETGQGALAHFVETGLERNYQPNRYLEPDWYLWQNPDARRAPHPLYHYLGDGGAQFRDPSPFVDLVQFRRRTGFPEHGAVLVNRICRGDFGPDYGVCRNYADLVAGEKAFLDSVTLNLYRENAAPKRKYLVWVQCRKGANFFNWYRDGGRNWDLLMNYYDTSGDYPDIGETVLVQKGTKFTAMFNVWRQLPDLFDGYEYVLFVDDDLLFRFEQVDAFFRIMAENALDLAQPSLEDGSHCVWPVFFNRKGRDLRYTNGVEIMMPAFSRRALDMFLPYFVYSVSGFGLDLLFAKLAAREGFKAAVVDKVQVRHDSSIDQQQGAYYEYLRSFNVNSKLELWRLMEMFELENQFYQV